jgi:hypothetical protein
MSMQIVTVMVPPLRPEPRGAVWVGAAISWLFDEEGRVRARLPAWLAAARARFALDRAARRDARNREDLFTLARRYQPTQPEFAKDLFAAASNDGAR